MLPKASLGLPIYDVVGEHSVQPIGKDLDHFAWEGGAIGLGAGVQEGNVDEALSCPGPADGRSRAT